MALVSLDGVRKSFGSRTVLDGLAFAIVEVRDGEIHAYEGGYSNWFERTSGSALAAS